MAQPVGAAARHRAKEAHASSQSAGLPEATGAPRAWEGTCFSVSCGFVFYFTVSRSKGRCVSGMLNSKQTLHPQSSASACPPGSGWDWPESRVYKQWLASSSHPGLGSGGPHPQGIFGRVRQPVRPTRVCSPGLLADTFSRRYSGCPHSRVVR